MSNLPLDYTDDMVNDQIEEGTVSHDGIRYFPDGTALMGESSPDEMPPIQTYKDHHENMAEWLSDGFMREAGNHLKKNIEDDAKTQETTNQYTIGEDTLIMTVKKDRKTYFEYEMELNESKRNIKLLKNQYVNNIEEQLYNLMN